MATKSGGSKIKRVIYVFLSFVMSLLLLVLTFSVVLQTTIFNENFFLSKMNETEYFTAKKTEITRSLMDLGYASGLDEEFFNNLIDDSLLRDDTIYYLDGFFSGDRSVVDTKNFEDVFNKALDKYIEKKQINPETVNKSSVDNLVRNASKIYRNSLSLPLFQTIAGYFVGLKQAMPITIAVVGVLIFFIFIILFFSTKWKHRPVRYMCYSTTTTFLTTIVPAVALLASGKAKQLNVTSKAFYDFFVKAVSDMTFLLLFISIGFAVLSMVLFVLCMKLYPKRSSSGGSKVHSDEADEQDTNKNVVQSYKRQKFVLEDIEKT